MTSVFPLLAQSTDPSAGLGRFFLATILVLVIIGGLIGLLYVFRKRFMADQNEDRSGAGGFSLGQLRQLVKEGKMSQEEFDAAKAQIVAAMQRAAARDKPHPDLVSESKLDEPK
jgi:hypothetical protein